MASEPAREEGWAYRLGCAVSDKVSDLFAHPYAQVAFLLVCVAWFAIGWNVNILTAALSILAITLTQMVLNSQNEREIDDHRRDVAMHAKLDELIAANKRAKNEFVGIEDREEEKIVELKEEVKEAVEKVADEEVAEDAAREVAAATAKKASRKPRKKAAAKRGTKTRARR
jgi:low affinity Fe/Cu permease